MLKEPTVRRSEDKRSSVTEQAKALAVILREEFGVAFMFYDVERGEAVRGSEPESNGTSGETLDSAAALELAGDGRARVTPLTDKRYQLSLLHYRAQKPVLLAVGRIDALAQ